MRKGGINASSGGHADRRELRSDSDDPNGINEQLNPFLHSSNMDIDTIDFSDVNSPSPAGDDGSDKAPVTIAKSNRGGIHKLWKKLDRKFMKPM